MLPCFLTAWSISARSSCTPRCAATADKIVLQRGEIRHRSVKFLCPENVAGLSLDQLRALPQIVGHPPHVAFEKIANPEVSPDLAKVDSLIAIHGRCARGDDLKPIVDRKRPP